MWRFGFIDLYRLVRQMLMLMLMQMLCARGRILLCQEKGGEGSRRWGGWGGCRRDGEKSHCMGLPPTIPCVHISTTCSHYISTTCSHISQEEGAGKWVQGRGCRREEHHQQERETGGEIALHQPRAGEMGSNLRREIAPKLPPRYLFLSQLHCLRGG